MKSGYGKHRRHGGSRSRKNAWDFHANRHAPQVFLSRMQDDNLDSLSFYVRGSIDSDALMRTIPRVISNVAPDLTIRGLETMSRQVDDNVYVDRLVSMLSASFGGLAMLLAAIGLYGVLAYNIAQRTREFGLRLALGAAPGQLRAMVLKQAARMALIGGGIGLAIALGLGRVAEALLFGVSGHDPFVLIAAVALIAGIVLAASYWPARRASRIAPMEALHWE